MEDDGTAVSLEPLPWWMTGVHGADEARKPGKQGWRLFFSRCCFGRRPLSWNVVVGVGLLLWNFVSAQHWHRKVQTTLIR